MKLTYKDYKDILKFYKIDISTLKRSDIKEKAEHLLATKLCKCIKSIKSGKAIKCIVRDISNFYFRIGVRLHAK